MATPVAFFGGARLGDFISGPPSHSPEAEYGIPAPTLAGNTAAVVERRPSSRHSVTIEACLFKDSGETRKAFASRRYRFVNALRSAVGPNPASIYTTGRMLTIIPDIADAAVTTATVSAGDSSALVTNVALGAESGDVLAFIGSGGATAYGRVATVSTSTEYVLDGVTSEVASGSFVAVADALLPIAYWSEMPEISGIDPGSDQASQRMRFRFWSPVDWETRAS
jgi:hypothetical protein